MYATKSILLFIVIMYRPLRIYSLAFGTAIPRNRQRSLEIVQTQSYTKCPFASVTKWLRTPQTIDDSSHVKEGVSVQYTEITQTEDVTDVPMTTSTDPISLSHNSRSGPWTRSYRMRIEKLYRDALSLRCPFFRRRATDALEFTDSTIRQLIGKNDAASLGPTIALRGIENGGEKLVGLSLEEIADVIRKDWRIENNKGYYVTGRLTANVYRDDCLFDGPDPDMPVRGIRKYMNAASQLFEYKSSTSELLSLHINEGTAVAKWRFNGTMRLPWKPKLPEVTGTTTYHVDSSGLIYKHIETWDISAFQAFVQTFLPKLSQKIWPRAPIEL